MSSEKKKAAIYCRVSTHDQSLNDYSSLDQQKDLCEEYIKRKGSAYQIYKVYKDTRSAKDLNRPGVKKLLEDANKGKFDLIVITKLDRISRSTLDFLTLYEDLQKLDIDIAVTTQEIDTTKAAGRAMQSLLLVFAQFEREMISQRTREKAISAIKKGIWTGGYIPLGYDKIDKKLVVNKTEAKLVNYIFDLYLEHKSSPKVVKVLNLEGHRTKQWKTEQGTVRGGKKFRSNSVYTILKKRLYIGEFELEGEVYKTQYDSIVSKDKFHKVQSILEDNRIKPKQYTKGESPTLLQGIFDCGFCSQAMTSSYTSKKGTRYYYYKCSKKTRKEALSHTTPKICPMLR